ncbi:GNAT family N-acetyltransferase [Kitasatospora camelliae]|uniref:GNAT family N-acetyltransferase n=1 Tax=Kitasatospora camelliae TaxID=3156397 RepID=A0AAU8JRC1_9ACTN
MSAIHHPPAEAEALLADGTTAVIRALVPADRDAVRDLLAARMSEAGRRLRFLGATRRDPLPAADRLCGGTRPDLLALGAWVGEELVGEADCELTAADGRTAELSLAVAEAWHHRGVATPLVERLVQAARERGVTAFEADTLTGNRTVHKPFSDLGLPVHRRLARGGIRVRVSLDESDEHSLQAVDRRGGTADLAGLAALLRPRSVAVVGASRRPGSVGHTVLRKIREGGFTGALWAVNPYAGRIGGEIAYPGLAELPGTPELAVLAVPPAVVPGVARACGAAGVRALVVLASRLDADQARELMYACRRHGMRLVGPNSFGIAQTAPGVRLDAEFGGVVPLPGTAGVAVQSGGVGIALLERLAWLGIGVSSFVSLGDKYDVSGNDLLQWWESDGCTDLALLHVESFGSPRAFSSTARRVSRTLPVLTVDAGRSAAGRRGAASHTAAAATPTVTREALFRQTGITATRSVAELVDTAALLYAQPLPAERGAVAVLSNAGGIGILAADACAEAGLTLPTLPADLAAALAEVLPAGASAVNPVDTTAEVGPAELRAAIDLLARSDAVDALLLCLVPTALTSCRAEEPVRALLDGPARRTIPLAAVLVSQEAPICYLTCADGGLLPSYTDPDAAAHALAHARERARWLAEPPSPLAEPDTVDTAAARRLVDTFLADHPRGGRLDPSTTADLLDCYNLPMSASIMAVDEYETVLAAQSLSRLGHDGAIVLKAYRPESARSPAQDAVRTGLRGDAQVRAAYRELADRPGARMAGAVVQPMAAPGLELLAGVVQDPVFGPLVVLGLGGTAADHPDARSARLVPLTERDLAGMLTDLPGTPLPPGRSGSPPPGLPGLRQVLAGLSRMAADLPQLAEADLNPLIARPDGLLCVDARIRLEPRPSFDPYLRRPHAPATTPEARQP